MKSVFLSLPVCLLAVHWCLVVLYDATPAIVRNSIDKWLVDKWALTFYYTLSTHTVHTAHSHFGAHTKHQISTIKWALNLCEIVNCRGKSANPFIPSTRLLGFTFWTERFKEFTSILSPHSFHLFFTIFCFSLNSTGCKMSTKVEMILRHILTSSENCMCLNVLDKNVLCVCLYVWRMSRVCNNSAAASPLSSHRTMAYNSHSQLN